MKRKLLILFLTCVVGWLSPLNAQTTVFSDDFETGEISSAKWVIFQEDSDDYQWTLNNMLDYAYNGSDYSIISHTYMNGNLSPDNYIVTKDKYTIDESSKFSYAVRAFDGAYNKENYSVVVSEDGSNWIDLFTEQYTQTAWKIGTISFSDYPDYIGKTIAIGFRHHDCTGANATALLIDDVVLSDDEPTELTVTVTASDTDVYIGETVTLTASATGGSGSYNSYVWDCTSHTLEGTEFWGSGNAYEHTFLPTATGNYTFTCTVTDSESNTATSEHVVTVTEESESAIDLNKQYRVKVYSGNNGVGNYLTAHDNYQISTSNLSNVSTKTSVESNTQIFTIEQYAENTYYLKTLDGYYIKCNAGYNSWNVDCYSTSAKTPLLFEYVNENFYIRDTEKNSTDNYFKVDSDGKVYCDKPKNDSGTVTWVLEEYVKPLDFTINLPKTYVCDTEETIQLTANVVSGNGGYTYTWTGEGINATDIAIANPTVTIPDVYEAIKTYVYTCTVSDAKGKTDTKEVYLYVCDVITDLTLIAGETTIVEGNSTTLTSNIPDKYNNWTIRWEPCVNVKNSCNGGITNETTALTETTTFKLTATNPNNSDCYSVAQVTVNVTPDPSLRVEVNAEKDNICDNETTQFNAVASRGSGEGYTYLWSTNAETTSPIDCLSDKYAANPFFTPVENTKDFQTYEYVCTVTDSKGDTAEAKIEVFVRDYYELTPIVEYVEYGNPITFDFSAYPGIWQVNAYDVLEYDAFTTDYVNNKFTINSVTEDIYLTLNVSNVSCESTTGITIIATNVPVKPETDVIGDGDNWMEDAYYLPTYTSQDYVLSQQIYTQDELLTMLEENATINKIAFKASVVKNTAATRNFDIYLLNTEQETFESADDFVSIPIENRYYSGEVIFTEDEWAEIELNKGFQYDNKNVILCVSDWTGPYKSTMNEALAAVEEASWLPVNQEPAKQLIMNLFGNDDTKKLSQYEAEDLIASTEMPTWDVTDADGNPTGETETMDETQAQLVVQYTFNSAGRNDYYGYPTSNRAILKYNYSKASEAYDAPDFAINNTFEESKALSYNSQIQLTYTKWAGDPTLKAEITADKTSICDGEDGNRFYLTAAKVQDATYEWYNGETLVGAGEKITYSNANPGTYTIKLVVTQNGVSKEVTKELTINPMPNAAVVMGTNGYGFVGETLTYTVNNHIDGTKYAIELVVDGALYPASSNPTDETDIGSHVFDNDGTFYYTVDADREGCTAEETHGVVIYPKATFNVSNLCAGQDVVFTNTTLTPNGDDGWNFGEGEGFVWNFNGEEVVSNNATVTHTFAEAGTYPVTLTVTKSGVSNVATQSVVITASPVVVNLSWDKTTIYEDITFTATSNIDASYIWEIDDVVQDEDEATFTYQFQSLGDHKVAVTAVSATGCSTRREETITITEKSSEPKVMVNNVEVSSIDMGFRPYGAWMRPIEILITPDGTTDLTIDSITIEDRDDVSDINFIYMTDEVKNATIKPEKTLSVLLTHDIDNKVIKEEIAPGHSGFANTATMTINYGENQTKVINIKYNAYEPKKADVWENTYEITVGGSKTDNLTVMRSNYLLEGATSAHKDAVYKLSLSTDAKVTATVTGTNPLVYVYPGDFGGEGGPGLTNYVGYVNPDAPVQLEFEGFNIDFSDIDPFNGVVKEGTLWTSGPNDGNEYSWFQSGNDDYDNPDVYITSRQRTADNYFITKDKYYISETAKFSMNVWRNSTTASHSYYVFVSEDGTNFTSVYEGTVSIEDKTSIDISLSDYAGKEYYVGVVHKAAATASSARIRFDNFKLYEPEPRGTRASADGSLDIMLEDGTYYLVAAAENPNFTVTVSAVKLSVPMQATNPNPGNKDTNVPTTLEQLTWTFGENTEKYQVLFGTTEDLSTDTDVLVDWNSNIENASCALSTPLDPNTVYYWQVNARNIAGETEGLIWKFATPFDAPQNLALTSTEINVGETSTLTWEAVAPTTITGYNIWAGNKLLTEEPTTDPSYTINKNKNDLGFSAEPYKIYVEAIYMVGDLRITSKSSSVELKVNAEASVKGFVYDVTTGEPIEGATVTYATKELKTLADGSYTGTVPAGNYTAVARMSGYNKCEVPVEPDPSEEKAYSFYLEPTKTMATGVIATENAEKTAVDVKWQFNSEGDPMFENFENGFTYEWTTSADYPWTVVDITGGPGETTVDANVFGQKCAKSGNSGVPSSTSWIELSAFIPFDGKISFYYRISSENPSDYGSFYIGEDQQFIIDYEGDPNAITAGSTLWQDGYREFDVKAGEHTFRWEYVKDYGSNVDEDAFYIDNISFYKNTNVYNVYRQDILTPAAEPVLLEDSLTKKEFEDAKWATETDGIYQWGVSAIYNEKGNTLSEDFSDGTMSMGWTKTDLSTGWNNWLILNQQVDSYFQAYDGYSIICSGQDTDDRFYLVTPEIDASIQSTLEFVCIAPQYGDLEEYFNKFRVVYGDTPTGPWTPLTDYNTASVEAWTPMEVSLPLQKTLYIAFENYDHETGYGLGLDNVVVRREAVTGESNIAWSNLIGKGNELVNDGDWDDENNWSREKVPTAEEVAVIKAAGTVNEAGAVANAVLVDNGTLTIGENGVLAAQIVIDSVATDITITAGGQLVHSNEGVMAIFIKGIEPYADAAKNDGWYTISSPLAADINASQVSGLLEGEFDLYRYDEPTHYWENYEDAKDAEGPDNTDWDNYSAVIEKGRGYLYANGADKQLSFAGELNVADVKTTLSAQASSLTGFNLLGNPFAHNIYKGVAFNGSIADAHYTLNYHGEWQVVTSDNPIKSGAGFLVQAKEGTDLTISKTNAKPQTRAAANSMLAVTVVNNVFEDVAYVSFNDGIGLEKIGHMNEYAPMVYIPGDFNNYAYATVEEDVTEVPVNFEAMTMGEYTIAVKAKNCEYETMVLVDNLTGKETNLLKDSYTFMATTTDDPDRFVIKLAKDAEVEDSFIYINNGELIFDNLSNDAIINVFDVLGRNVATFNNCGDTTFRVSTDLFADGVYMVRVIEGNNVKVQKMVIE